MSTDSDEHWLFDELEHAVMIEIITVCLATGAPGAVTARRTITDGAPGAVRGRALAGGFPHPLTAADMRQAYGAPEGRLTYVDAFSLISPDADAGQRVDCPSDAVGG
ncbi:hypothetical protein [Streptomyces luteireticuli]|uniref:hypothetical protein n=1 Tax=Streptomyces luteireticuli TaxID=173858 RepID=UPI0031DBE074